MDILLTPTQLDTLYESNREYHEYSPEKWEQAICRAQVRQVVEWLEEDCLEHNPPAYMLGYPIDRASCPECWQALRAAGGEG